MVPWGSANKQVVHPFLPLCSPELETEIPRLAAGCGEPCECSLHHPWGFGTSSPAQSPGSAALPHKAPAPVSRQVPFKQSSLAPEENQKKSTFGRTHILLTPTFPLISHRLLRVFQWEQGDLFERLVLHLKPREQCFQHLRLCNLTKKGNTWQGSECFL